MGFHFFSSKLNQFQFFFSPRKKKELARKRSNSERKRESIGDACLINKRSISNERIENVKILHRMARLRVADGRRSRREAPARGRGRAQTRRTRATHDAGRASFW